MDTAEIVWFVCCIILPLLIIVCGNAGPYGGARNPRDKN